MTINRLVRTPNSPPPSTLWITCGQSRRFPASCHVLAVRKVNCAVRRLFQLVAAMFHFRQAKNENKAEHFVCGDGFSAFRQTLRCSGAGRSSGGVELPLPPLRPSPEQNVTGRARYLPRPDAHFSGFWARMALCGPRPSGRISHGKHTSRCRFPSKGLGSPRFPADQPERKYLWRHLSSRCTN